MHSDDDRSLKENLSSGYHEPVLLEEVLQYLAVEPGNVYVDCTLGGGGYAERLLERSAPNGLVYGFDTDPAAMDFASRRLATFGNRFILVRENFSSLESALQNLEVREVDGIVYDLGVSSHQLDTESIGLSYRVDAPLDMRLDPRLKRSAYDIVNTEEDTVLKQIFRHYGEEPYAGPIARRIVQARQSKPIETTTELAAIVSQGVREDKKASTLSRIFQALRIEVNHELESLTESLKQAVRLLRPGGRVVVVSYHSLEDRIVKEFFREQSEPKAEPGSLRSLKVSIDKEHASLDLLTRKPVTPSEAEINRNTRARSAKLRAAQKR